MGGKVSQQIIMDQTNSMVANVMTNIAMSCSTVDTTLQNIVVDCENIGGTEYTFENGPRCRNCIDKVVQSQLDSYDFERTLWARGDKDPGVSKPIDMDFQATMEQFVACGATYCKACSVTDLSQKTTVDLKLDCKAMNNVTNVITQKLVDALTQKLVNNQGMLGGLMTMFGASTTANTILKTANLISAKLDTNIIQKISQQISTQQTIKISAGDTVVQGTSQENTVTSVESYLAKNKVLNTILSEAQWKQLAQVVNNQNTLDELGNAVVKATAYLRKLVTGVVGRVVIFVYILVGVVFLAVVLYVSVKLIRRKWQQRHKQNEAARRAIASQKF